MKPTYGIDFDGVIHRYSKGWFDGTVYDEPMPGAIEGLRVLMQHAAVFVHTARSVLDVAPWLVQQGFDVQVDYPGDPTKFWTERGVLLVTQRKLPAKAYLDDRAVKFTSWELALAELLPEEARAAPAAAGAGMHGAGDGLISVSVEDLRKVVGLARCHVDSAFCAASAEGRAATERLDAQLKGEQSSARR